MRTIIVLVSMLALFLSSSAFGQKLTYGVLMKTLSNPFWGAMKEGVRDGSLEAGVNFYLQAAESDQAAEPQLNLCMTMLERNPDVMITAAINSTILLPCLKKANEANIPVIDLDGNLDHDIAAKAGVSIDFTIGSDNEAAGAQGADYVAKVLGKDATGPVLVIEGLSGNITGQKRARGFANRIKKIAPGLVVVASLPGDWDRMKAMSITNDILTRNPNLKAIFAANDGMALGAVEAAYTAGKGDDIVIVGVDGNSDAVKSIKAGRLNASVAQLPYLVGKRAVIGATVSLHGLKLQKFQFVDTLVLTKDIIEKNTHPLMKYVK